MPIDSSIYFQQKPVDLVGSYQQGLNMRQLMDERALAKKQLAEQEAIKQAYSAGITTDPSGQVSFDQQKTLSALAKASPMKAYEAQQQFTEQATKAEELKAKKSLQQIDLWSRVFGGVKDQSSYENAIKSAGQLGLKMPPDLPSAYDPGLIGNYQMRALSAKEQLQHRLDQQRIGIDREKLGIDRERLDIDRMKAKAEKASSGLKMTEAQSKSLGFGRRAMLADQMINKISEDPSFDVSSLQSQVRMGLPKWLGGIKDDREQALTTAKVSFIASVLRKESGAAVTPEEFGQYDKMYFPQPGDSPQTQLDKRILRQNFIDTEKLTAGAAWRNPIPLQKVDEKSIRRPEASPMPDLLLKDPSTMSDEELDSFLMGG